MTTRTESCSPFFTVPASKSNLSRATNTNTKSKAMNSHLLFLLLSLVPTSTFAQLGTTQVNVSSDSTAFTYVSTWRSDLVGGPYEAYSNASDASVIFSFLGVETSYIAISKSDRGLCILTLDDQQAYTVDLFDNSGYAQVAKIHWTSPVLPYGRHNVTISQIGIDARLGLVFLSLLQLVPLLSFKRNFFQKQILPLPLHINMDQSSTNQYSFLHSNRINQHRFSSKLNFNFPPTIKHHHFSITFSSDSRWCDRWNLSCGFSGILGLSLEEG